MDLVRLFRLLVASELLLFLIFGFFSFNESPSVAAFNEDANPFSSDDVVAVGLLLLIALLLLYLLSVGLLLALVNFGRWLYLFVAIASSIFGIFLGPSAGDPIPFMLEHVGSMVSGAILVFMFFTPVRDRFTGRDGQANSDPKIFA